MDAVTYLREKGRMVKIIDGEGCGIICSDCPLSQDNNCSEMTCIEFESKYPQQAIGIVKAWSKNHPRKTYMQDFFEKFPNAKKYDDGTLRDCRNNIYGNAKDCSGRYCDVCWNEPMEGKQ